MFYSHHPMLLLFGLFGCIVSLSCTKTNDWNATFNEAGMVNVQELDSTIKVNLAYSTPNNVLGYDVYGDLEEAYLRPEAAEKLVLAQKNLQAYNASYTLYIYDATRPRRIQQKLWDESELPIEERSKYIAHPERGSIHNYGMAVDLGIWVDGQGLLDMGTSFDDFSLLSHIDSEDSLIRVGALEPVQVHNRLLLREVMTSSGFLSLASEWWHFDAMERSATKEQFDIIE
jgi:zinc D-Ala-D-Ala dipeptidase